MPARLRRTIWIAGAVSLAVTALRLIAELRGVGSLLASRDGGGPGALIGIAWLMPVFGALFGWQLAGEGLAPERPLRAALRCLALAFGAMAFGVAAMLAFGGPEEAFPGVLFVNAVFYVAAAWFAWRQWPELGRANFCYALLARAPVIVITVIAVTAEWGTHYEKIGPGDGVAVEPFARTLMLIFAQVFVWVPLTVLFGGVGGAFAATVRLARMAPRAVA